MTSQVAVRMKDGAAGQRVEQALQARRDAFGGAIAGLGGPAEAEQKEMLALRVGQHHRAGNAIEYVGGRRTAAPLFQPGVPGGAHIGALRHLLAPQPRRSPPLQRKAEGRGIELGAAIPEIGPKLVRVRHPVSDYTPIRSLLYPNE